MTIADLHKKAAEYDRINNEGGEGYNPYRAEIEQRQADERRNAPREEYDVLRDLEIYDSTLARECGTYDEAKVAALRAELAVIEQAEQDEFLTEWTIEVTRRRRIEWNEMGKSGRFGTPTKPDYSAARKQETAQGWHLSDLKKAIDIHKL